MSEKVYLTKWQYWLMKVSLFLFWPIWFYVLGVKGYFEMWPMFTGGFKEIEVVDND